MDDRGVGPSSLNGSGCGFLLLEDVVKLPHEMKSTRKRWRGSMYNFYLIARKHPLVFRKPRMARTCPRKDVT